jgi:Zn-dependent protease with chaperone function/Flp pilus assembly protein TadD
VVAVLCRIARVLAVVLLAGLAAARAGATDLAAYEAHIDSILRARDVVADSLFRLANQARGRGDHPRAVELYSAVLRRAPDFLPALRRRAGALLALGQRDTALAHLREAVRREPSAPNLAALGFALLAVDAPLNLDAVEARGLLERALALEPDDPYAHVGLFRAGMVLHDAPLRRRASAELLRLAPGEAQTWYLAFTSRALDGDRRGAREALERARVLGLPPEAYQHGSTGLAPLEARARHLAWLMTGVWVLLGWIAGMLVLLAVGAVLSRATLRIAARVPGEASGRAAGADAWLRRAYAAVLWVCCAYYYASIPVMLGLVLALGAGLVYGAFQVGHVPIKLVLIVVVLVLATVVSVVRSLFARGRDEDPGVRLDLSRNPRLRAVLDEVAGRVGTRPVNTVYVTPGTEVGVFERGGMMRQLRGATERCLVLGLGVVTGMRLREFKAVLAHEYGHFSNRDTAGGGFALGVRRSLAITAMGLAEQGAAGWFNPAWLFVNGFFRLFMRVSHGASRLQEVLADRWAAFTYGSEAFVRGLTHVIDASVRFPARAEIEIREAVEQKRPLADLFGARALGPEAAAEVERGVRGALEAEPTAYDSHPAPALRIAWVRALASRGGDAADDDDEVWTLLPERAEVERTLTRQVRDALVLEQGLMIPSGPKPEAAG